MAFSEFSRSLWSRNHWTGVMLVLLLLTMLAACSLKKGVYSLRIPGVWIELAVESAQKHGPIIAATLREKDLELRYFTNDDEDCRAVLVAGTRVRYRDSGPLGVIMRTDDHSEDPVKCMPQGIGALQIQSARRPRSQSPRSPVPRSQASFDQLFADDELRLLSGRFPSAARVGWTGADRTIVVVPRSSHCDALGERGVASMEYRASGRSRLVLLAGGGLCNIIGLIRNLPSDTSPP